MSKGFTRAVIVLSVILSTLTTYVLWTQFGWHVGIQVLVTLLIAAVGEHHVSGRGYYRYTPANGVFIGRVPVWILFMWVSACNSVLILSLVGGLSGMQAMLGAGTLGMVADLVIIEPIFSRMKGLWLWTPVQGGYFSFVPSQLNRFTAPVGNYLVWFVFPFLMSWLLGCFVVLF